ncbi:MAG: hypothetical protein LBE16_05140 [Clostridiales Family XIII bacterium]|jgi:hypothetical protein|nr:hypothetical protein [Clostridiales Family XIII bacterium]
MSVKQDVIGIVESLPDSVAFDEIVNTLAVICGDRRAADDICRGRVSGTEQMLEALLLPES